MKLFFNLSRRSSITNFLAFKCKSSMFISLFDSNFTNTFSSANLSSVMLFIAFLFKESSEEVSSSVLFSEYFTLKKSSPLFCISISLSIDEILSLISITFFLCSSCANDKNSSNLLLSNSCSFSSKINSLFIFRIASKNLSSYFSGTSVIVTVLSSGFFSSSSKITFIS